MEILKRERTQLLFSMKEHFLSDKFSDMDKQYIATVNQNQLDEIKKHMSDKEYKKIIIKSTVLTLTDESDTAKLLGIKVDLGEE